MKRSNLEIPRQATPVVRVLRREVRKPDPSELIWTIDGPRWAMGRGKKPLCCPLGLLPYARSGVPCKIPRDFKRKPEFTNDNLDWFIAWWDNLDVWEAKDAVDKVIWKGLP